MADPAIWQSLIETGNPYVQQERQQKGLMGMMLLQEKQRQIEDAQRLRDLYSSPSEPSIRDVMAINPEFGMKMQGERFKLKLQNLALKNIPQKPKFLQMCLVLLPNSFLPMAISQNGKQWLERHWLILKRCTASSQM
jgi:hypothetical protein